MTNPAAALDALPHLATDDLVELFLTLDAPALDQMDGDFDATLLRQPSTFATVSGKLSVDTPWARWKSKGFRPVDLRSGRGYNSFTRGNGVVQRYPMQTRIVPSRYDGKPAYSLIYPAYRSFVGAIGMVDEVRVLESNVYLGIGTWGFTDAQRHIALPFVLKDTGRGYLGDIGRARKGYVASRREIPALGRAQSGAPVGGVSA